MTNMC